MIVGDYVGTFSYPLDITIHQGKPHEIQLSLVVLLFFVR